MGNKKWLNGLAIGAVLVLLAACGDSEEGAGETSADSVTAYCSMSEGDCRMIVDDFKDQTGVTVNYVRLSVGENLARIKAESANPKASLWIGGSAETYIEAANDDLLTPYTAEGVANVDPQYVDPDNFWTPTSTAPVGFASNTRLLAELGVDPPTSWEDLADPRLENSIALAHPASSGTGAAVVSTLAQLYDEDDAFELMKRIDANVAQYTKSGGAPTRMTGLGEVAVSATYVMDIELGITEGYDIVASFPNEGTGFGINAAALIANGPSEETEGAQKFLDWILTDDGQKSMMKTFWRPVMPGIENPDSKVDTDDVKLIAYDTFWAGENRTKLIERFESEIRRGSEAQ